MNQKAEAINLSIVIPVYGCDECLSELAERLEKVLTQMKLCYEVILVDDRSKDDSWKSIKKIVAKNHCFKGIRLSRNFGQHFAITAGTEHTQGEWVVVMDCDLQDLPEEIPNLYAKKAEGYDIVYARRIHRKDSWLKKIASKVYYRIFDLLTGLKSDETIANFGIYAKKVIDQVKLFKECNRSFPLFTRWVGFSSTAIEVRHSERLCGKTSYSVKKLFSLAIDTIFSYSNKPLKICIFIGLLMSVLSAGYVIYLILNFLVLGAPITGWTNVMVSLYFLSGLILVSLGITGIYIDKIFDETKKRPLYIIDETTD